MGWSRACELVRDMEAPTPTIAPITRTTIANAIEHFLKLKTGNRTKLRDLGILTS
jgi:hypothetical protein